MKIRTPLGLFVGLTVAGMPLALGTGHAIGIHNTSYEPIPQPQKPPTAVQDYGNAVPRITPVPTRGTGTKSKGRVVVRTTPKPQVQHSPAAPKATTNSTRIGVTKVDEPPTQNTAPSLCANGPCPEPSSDQGNGASQPPAAEGRPDSDPNSGASGPRCFELSCSND